MGSEGVFIHHCYPGPVEHSTHTAMVTGSHNLCPPLKVFPSNSAEQHCLLA